MIARSAAATFFFGGGVINAPPIEVVLFNLDFTNPSEDLSNWTYSGQTGNGNGVEITINSRYRTFAANILRRWNRGAVFEPTSVNIAPNPRLVAPGGNPGNNGNLSTMVPTNTESSVVLGTDAIAITSGSMYITITVPAHGWSVGDHIRGPVGGSSIIMTGFPAGSQFFNNTVANAYSITKVPDANTIVVKQNREAVSSGNYGTGSTIFRSRPTATNPFPDGFSLENVNPAISILQSPTYSQDIPTGGVSDAQMQNTPTAQSCGARRALEFAGIGTQILWYGIATGLSVGNTVVLQQIINAYSQIADYFNFVGVGSLNFVFQEQDGSGNNLGSPHRVDLASQLAPQCYRYMYAKVVLDQASVSQVKYGIEIVGIDQGCDLRFSIFEQMLSIGSWKPDIILPPINTIATASRNADVFTTSLSTSIAFQGQISHGLAVTEIVNNVDCIWSAGDFQLNAVGLSWPRDLVITDGTNSVTAHGVLYDNFITQGYDRIVVSWGSGQMFLAMNGISYGSSSYKSNATTNFRFGQDKNGINSSVRIYNARMTNQQYSGDLASYSDIFYNITQPLPGRDFAVGRISVNPTYNLAAIFPTGSSNLVCAPNSSANGFTVTGGSGNIAYNAVTKLISFGSGIGSVLAEDVDFTGTAISYSPPCPSLVIRNCIFDQSAPIASGQILTIPANTSSALIEYCDFIQSPSANPNVGMFVQILNSNTTVRRNYSNGSVADFCNLVGGSVIENRYEASAGLMNKHSDFSQCNGTSLSDMYIQNNLIDMRNRKGSLCDQNSVVIVGNTNGPMSYAVNVNNNVILGSTNQIQFAARAPNTITRTWRGTSSASVANNCMDMTTNTPLDLRFGADILIEYNGTITTPVTSNTSIKLGWEEGPYTNSYRAGALYATNLVNPATPSSLLNALSSSFVNGDIITLNGNNISVLTSGASGDNQINVNQSLSNLFTKFSNLIPGMSFTMVPFTSTVNGNKTVFMGTSIP